MADGQAGPFRYPAVLQSAAAAAAQMRSACGTLCVNEGAMIDLELAFVEAVNNVVLHAYGGKSGGEFEFSVRKTQAGVEIEIADRGMPVLRELFEAPSASPLDAECGRGISIIRACVDRLDYWSEAGANHLLLGKHL